MSINDRFSADESSQLRYAKFILKLGINIAVTENADDVLVAFFKRHKDAQIQYANYILMDSKEDFTRGIDTKAYTEPIVREKPVEASVSTSTSTSSSTSTEAGYYINIVTDDSASASGSGSSSSGVVNNGHHVKKARVQKEEQLIAGINEAKSKEFIFDMIIRYREVCDKVVSALCMDSVEEINNAKTIRNKGIFEIAAAMIKTIIRYGEMDYLGFAMCCVGNETDKHNLSVNYVNSVNRIGYRDNCYCDLRDYAIFNREFANVFINAIKHRRHTGLLEKYLKNFMSAKVGLNRFANSDM